MVSKLLLAGLGLSAFASNALGQSGKLVDPNLADQPGVTFMAEKQAAWDQYKAEGSMPHPGVMSSSNEARVCTNGYVNVNGENYPCDGVDFLSLIALRDLDIDGRTTQGSDIWGWLSPTNKEITIECVDNGVWFVDGTDPTDPVRLGFIRAGRPQFAWCDVKVYENTVYIVKDGGAMPNYGIEVFDLLRLENLNPSSMPYDLSPDYVYTGHGNSHNLVVDTEQGVLYSVGTGRSTQCRGGLHMLDIKSNRLRPQFLGCAASDGYTHDAQCVTYDGPDSRYQGREICFAYNEDTLTIWDVTDKSSPVIVSRTGYNGATYTHQGWLTEDMKHVLLDDELDEREGVVSTTRTLVFNVENLRSPYRRNNFDHPDVSVDHNLYVWGAIHKKGWGGNPAMANPPSSKYAYLSNYVAGLRILDVCDIDSGRITQAGYFDCAPDLTGNSFKGTWSNYMHPSGVVAISSIDRGLFFVRPQMAFDNAGCGGTSPPTDPPTDPPTPPTPPPTNPGGGDCADEVPSGIQYSDGTPAPCNELESYCSRYTFVKERCPATCGLCNTNCRDSVPSGLTYTDGSEAPCIELTRYCSVYQFVVDACPATCGACQRSFAKYSSEFKSLQYTLEEDDQSETDQTALIVGGVLGVACVGLASALVVTKRKLSKIQQPENSNTFVNSKNAITFTSDEATPAAQSNPMFTQA